MSNTCKDRVEYELQKEIENLTILWESYCKGEEETKELGSLYDYGLSFDYVEPGTFEGQREGYFRYQLSYGGPSDEFRFYADKTHNSWSLYRVEYWFLDWFDGASITLSGEKLDLLSEIFNSFFAEISCDYAYEEALKP